MVVRFSSPQPSLSTSNQFAGRVAIVTGAAGDLGRRIAIDLLDGGTCVAWVDRRLRRLQALVRGSREGATRSLVFRADLRVESDIRHLVDAVRGPTVPVTKLSHQAWQQVLEANLSAPSLCARECLRARTKRGQGRIINVSSMAGRMAYPMRAAYAVSKWGLIGLTLTLAQEAGAANVQVNAICPGPVEGAAMAKVIGGVLVPWGSPRARCVVSSYVRRPSVEW